MVVYILSSEAKALLGLFWYALVLNNLEIFAIPIQTKIFIE